MLINAKYSVSEYGMSNIYTGKTTELTQGNFERPVGIVMDSSFSGKQLECQIQRQEWIVQPTEVVLKQQRIE